MTISWDEIIISVPPPLLDQHKTMTFTNPQFEKAHEAEKPKAKAPSGLQGFFTSLLKDADYAIGSVQKETAYFIKSFEEGNPKPKDASSDKMATVEPEKPKLIDHSKTNPEISYKLEPISPKQGNLSQIEELRRSNPNNIYQQALKFA